MIFGRGRVAASDDTGPVQLLQIVLQGTDVRDNTPRAAEYGFTSLPLPGAQAVVLFMMGSRSDGVVIATNDERHRMANLLPGEVALYDDQGQSVYITRNGIVINGAGLPITINGNAHVTGNLQVDGTTTSTGTITTQGDVDYHGTLNHI